MMKKYKVISLYCPSGASKVFNYGDTVTESDFAEGTFAEKLKRGFLELVEGQETEPSQDPPPAADDSNTGGTDQTASSESTDDNEWKEGTEESPASAIAETLKKTVEATASESAEKSGKNVPRGTSEEGTGKTEEIKVKIDDIDIKQLRTDLKKAGIPFDKDAAKEVLFGLWQKRELTETI
jgi:hypothetical protein